MTTVPLVYFIQSEATRAIKIGMSTNPHGRLSALQSANGHNLRLLGTTTEYSERDLHLKFMPIRLRGEWFKPAPALTDFLRSLGLEPHRSNIRAATKAKAWTAATCCAA